MFYTKATLIHPSSSAYPVTAVVGSSPPPSRWVRQHFDKIATSIHPAPLSNSGSWGGYTQVAKLTQRDTTIHTYTQFRITNQTNPMNVYESICRKPTQTRGECGTVHMVGSKCQIVLLAQKIQWKKTVAISNISNLYCIEVLHYSVTWGLMMLVHITPASRHWLMWFFSRADNIYDVLQSRGETTDIWNWCISSENMNFGVSKNLGQQKVGRVSSSIRKQLQQQFATS